MPSNVADYAIIGDGRSCALIARNGSIDFLCWPRFDSDACFAALLGDHRHGCWRLAPARPYSSVRYYRNDTAVLETEHRTADGVVRVVDFMAWTQGPRSLVRIVEGVEGTVPLEMLLRLRFDFGRVPPWVHNVGGNLCAEIGPDRMVLHSDAEVACRGTDGTAAFTVAAGERVSFVLTYSSSFHPETSAPDAPALLDATERAWRSWIGRFDKPCEWNDAVKRSLMTLQMLIDRDTGGLVAAATTSLPEVPGGSLNWDYRYCWLRDATFTLTALLNAGFEVEAQRWRDWILRAVGGEPKTMQIAYRIDGGRRLHESKADWLPGFQGATPVRIGNAASGQTQVDVYGELLDGFDVAAKAGIERTERVKVVERAIVEHLESSWNDPGAGIWEARGSSRQHTYSQVMAWVGINRYVKSQGGADINRRLTALAATIHDTVCERGFSASLNRFTKTYDSDALDGSLLLLPVVGFLPATDPRIRGTIAAVERELMEGGLVRRHAASDGSEEGAFLACSCWLADCYLMQGRRDDARRMLERVISVANDVGLLSEEYHVPTQQLIGNMPQALSHIALINTALSLSGPVLQRGGG